MNNSKSKTRGILFGLLCVMIFTLCSENLWSNDGGEKIERDSCLTFTTGQFIDSLIHYLYDSFDYHTIVTSNWVGCPKCKPLLDRMGQCVKQYTLSDSNQKRRVFQHTVDIYNTLDTSKLMKLELNNRNDVALNLFLNTYFSLLGLKDKVVATFRDSVPDNKALYDELILLKNEQTKCYSTIATISQTIDSIKKIVSTMATGSFVSWGDTLKTLSTTIAGIDSQVTTMSLTVAAISVEVKTLAATFTSTATIVDSVLKILNNTVSRSCVVMGLAYYARGVVGGWGSIRLDSSAISFTGEILNYYDPVSADSHGGLKAGIGYMITDNCNISGGLLLFDKNVDPYDKKTLNLMPNFFHHISLSLDYWRANGLSLGLGYSALTGLGGRVLLGL